MISDSINRLVVLQSDRQVRHYLKIRQDSDLVLPIGPEAMYQACQQGWRVCGLDDLWPSEQYDAHIRASQERLESLISALNDYSRRWNPSLRLEIGHYYAFQLWIIIGQIRYNEFIARGILENLNPSKVLCYTKASPETFLELRPDPCCIFADVLVRSRLQMEGRCEILKIDERRKKNTFREKLLSILPVPIRTSLRKIRDKHLLENSSSPTHKLLVIGMAGDWEKLSGITEFNHSFCLQRAPEVQSASSIRPPRELIELLNAAIQHDGLIPYDITKLSAAIEADLICFASKAVDIDAMIKNYDAAVTAVLSFPRDNFLAHRVALAGLPVLVWQHGEKGQTEFERLNVYTELLYATDYFAYASGVVQQYRTWIGKYRLENVVAVGSIEKHVKWQGGNNIVYATGKWFKTTHPIDPDRRLFHAHMTILGYLESLQGRYPIIFKANNTPGLNDIPYRFNTVKVEYASHFTDCLKTAKVVILDTPATTLVEACSTMIPIFVLGGRSRYTVEFLEIAKRRVVWRETAEELVSALAAFLDTGIYEADVEDRTLLISYGSEGKPVEIAQKVRDSVMDSIDRANQKRYSDDE